jgi:hypothetical protein
LFSSFDSTDGPDSVSWKARPDAPIDPLKSRDFDDRPEVGESKASDQRVYRDAGSVPDSALIGRRVARRACVKAKAKADAGSTPRVLGSPPAVFVVLALCYAR